MNAVFLDLGVIKIYWYSVMMFIAILVAGTLALKEAKKWQIPEDFMVNLFFFIVPISLIGARLYFVAFNWDYYSQHFIEIFKVWEGGLAIHGGIIAGLLFLLFYSKKYKINTKRLIDIVVVSLFVGQAIGRWGNFFNGEVYGAPVESLNWLPGFLKEGMFQNGSYHQPLFLYESIWCLIGFILALLIRRWPYLKIGNLTSFYLIWYGIGRFILEGLREEEYILTFGGIKIAQLVSVIMILIGIIYFMICKRGSKFDNRYNDKENVEHVLF